jgi:cellulose synthase/poly-beta-1,6-N-acetylglucosamine synthase-like glycosyltransferase
LEVQPRHFSLPSSILGTFDARPVIDCLNSDLHLPLALALLTPARNEADLIESTIKSVVAQTVRPVKWVIVSDGSTDGTTRSSSVTLPSIPGSSCSGMPERRDRQFAAKAHAFNAGLKRLQESDTPYDVVGNLDADITFEPDYFEFLLGRFEADPGLGVAGTPFVEMSNDTGQPHLRPHLPNSSTSPAPASSFARNASSRSAVTHR